METQEAETSKFSVVDKRKFANPDAVDINSAPDDTPRYPTYVEELMERMNETEKKFQEKKQQIDEEIGRVRTRLETDFEQRMELERCKLALPFLEVLDNLERAVDASLKSGSAESLREGVEMTAHIFRTKLKTIGVEAIPSLGRPFDPNFAQAVGMVEVNDSSQDGMVVEELQIGYTMGEQLLRPAQVRVGRNAG